MTGSTGEQGSHGRSDVNPDYGVGQNHPKTISGGCREGKLCEQGWGSLTFSSSVEGGQTLRQQDTAMQGRHREMGRPWPEKPEELEIVVSELGEAEGGNRGTPWFCSPPGISDFPIPVLMERGEK